MAHPMDSIRAWLAEKNPGVGEIPPDADLIENRLIDSLGFMEFIMLLESVTGRDLAVETMELSQFRTLAAIEKNFLPGTPDGPAPS
ncbi:acyl carrier protein [Streptomyces nondiastaticus]|uniref:acyl carrier protein n=1 Tax=Streptomyces TaxID=1883 RepID=UPI003429C624